jgi:hypothetical protein
MIPALPSTRIGFVHPNSSRLAAILVICSGLWVRGFRS